MLLPPWGSGGSVQRLPPWQDESDWSMDDVFAKSAKRVVEARDSRLRSRLVSIVLIVVTVTVRVVR